MDSTHTGTVKFFNAEKGFGFCNVVFGWDAGDIAYDNAQYTGWHTGYPDATAVIDFNTFRYCQHTCLLYR